MDHAPAATSPTRVFVLPQTHDRKLDPRQPVSYRRWLADYVAASQRLIAKTLLGDPRPAVFAEGVFNTYAPAVYRAMYRDRFSQMMRAQRLFSDKLFTSRTVLGESQKTFLREHGAARTLFLLGRLSRLYQTEDRSIKKAADASFEGARKLYGIRIARCLVLSPGSEVNQRVLRDREQAVIANIEKRRASLRSRNKSVFLIFGAAHNFLKYNTRTSKLKFIVHPAFKARFAKSQRNARRTRRDCTTMMERLITALAEILLHPLLPWLGYFGMRNASDARR